MKRLIILLIFVSSFAFGQNSSPSIGQVFNTIADMQTQKGTSNSVAYVIGGTAIQDFRGAFYVWDATSTAAPDMTYYNVIQVTGINTGRWIRSNQSSVPLPQGMLFRIGPLKILAVSGTSNASGEFVLNTTLDNTATGTAIFSSILFNSTMAISGSATPNDAIQGSIKSVGAGNKVITYRYTKGNSLGVGVLVSVVSAGAGAPIQCFVVGL